MAKEIELSSLDLRYEGYRMKNPGLEERLLVSIAQRGIEEPLEGVQRQQASILLNGFKRYWSGPESSDREQLHLRRENEGTKEQIREKI